MKRKISVVSVALTLAVALMWMITGAQAMELPEGVTFKVLAEFPSDIPGIEKVQLQELRLEPGAKWENITVGDSGF